MLNSKDYYTKIELLFVEVIELEQNEELDDNKCHLPLLEDILDYQVRGEIYISEIDLWIQF